MNRTLGRKLLPIALALGVSVGAAAGGGEADANTAGLRTRAVQYMNASMSDFLAVKRAGPPPYDWSDDGCSVPRSWGRVVDDDYRRIFKTACQRHDFGYRNFGKGLRLDRREVRREWVDARFKADMDRICEAREAHDGIDACEFWAFSFHQAVRRKGASAFFG